MATRYEGVAPDDSDSITPFALADIAIRVDPAIQCPVSQLFGHQVVLVLTTRPSQSARQFASTSIPWAMSETHLHLQSRSLAQPTLIDRINLLPDPLLLLLPITWGHASY